MNVNVCVCVCACIGVCIAQRLLRGPGVDTAVRASAGLLLKNNILHSPDDVDESVVAFLHETVFQALLSDSHLIRTTASIMIAAIAVKTGVTEWQQLLPSLFQLLETNNPDAVDVSFSPSRALMHNHACTEGKERGRD